MSKQTTPARARRAAPKKAAPRQAQPRNAEPAGLASGRDRSPRLDVGGQRCPDSPGLRGAGSRHDLTRGSSVEALPSGGDIQPPARETQSKLPDEVRGRELEGERRRYGRAFLEHFFAIAIAASRHDDEAAPEPVARAG
jgi:hypothetical protein